MVPGAGDHPYRDALLLQLLEQQRGAALEQVVLTADQEGRHLDPLDHVDRRTVAVELPVVRRVAAEHRGGEQRPGERGRGRQPVEERLERRGRVVGAVRRRHQAGAGHQPEPQRDEPDVDLAAGGDDVAVDVGAGDLREDRLEPRRPAGGGEDLADPHVGRPGHPGLAVAPRLGVRPRHDRAGVVVLARAERPPDTLRRAGAPRVHGELHVAALDQVVRAGPPSPPPEDSTVLLYAVMVMITGSGRVTTEPSARVGRTRSPRSTTPSSMGIARSVVVAVPGYCSGRGFQCIFRAAVGTSAGSREIARGVAPCAAGVRAEPGQPDQQREDREDSDGTGAREGGSTAQVLPRAWSVSTPARHGVSPVHASSSATVPGS